MSSAVITLIFLVFAVVMFVWEKLPLALTSMIVCIGLVLTGVLEPAAAFSGFVDTNVILFVAMFIVGGAFFETGMADKVGGLVTKFAKSERQTIVAVMLVTGLMSGFLSNTGTAAVLIPVVIGIASKSGYSRSASLNTHAQDFRFSSAVSCISHFSVTSCFLMLQNVFPAIQSSMKNRRIKMCLNGNSGPAS